MPTPSPTTSLVIPAYNEEALLPRLLDTVDAARTRYHRGPDAVEIIVADNGSTDGTADLARSRHCQVVHVTKRCIGAARNGGARAARGRYLAFVDADQQLHPETFNEIDRWLGSPKIAAGSSGVRLERWSPGIAATFAMLMPLIWITRFDTGVTFSRREDFEKIGGYDESLPYAEDVDILWRHLKLARSRNQRLVRARAVKSIASMRKFDKHGDWHYFWLFGQLLLDTLRGRRDDRMIRYWYEPARASLAGEKAPLSPGLNDKL